MQADTVPFPLATPAQADAASSPGDKLLIDVAELAHLTSLSVRHLRRLDSSRDIPGRVACGRRVLFQTELIREWVRAGLPGCEQWAALQKRSAKAERVTR
jgi:hypothetical protein